MFYGPKNKGMSFHGEKVQNGAQNPRWRTIFFVFSDQKVRHDPKELPYKNWCLLSVCNQFSISGSIRLYMRLDKKVI